MLGIIPAVITPANGASSTTATIPSSTTQADLEALDEFLLSDRAPENSMGLSDLDGFLTGIIVGPELIMPSKWLPIIWGGDEPDFADIDEAQVVLGIIMARYNEIIAELDAGIDEFNPVFWEGREGQVIVSDWAAGFMDAVKLRPKAWEPLIRHKEARILMMPVLVLGADDPDNPPFGPRPLPEDEVEELFEHGAEIIPECVMGIYAFWREHGAQPAPKDTAVLRMYHNALQLLSTAIDDKTIRISRRPSPYPRNRFTAFK